MENDLQKLEQLNQRVGVEESQGDDASREWLNSILAPQFAFRRADGSTFDNREAFLAKIKPSGPRETEVVSIDLHGDRAIVACIVTMTFPAGQEKRFHNLRLFVRHEKQWKLLGWANEPV